MLYVSPDSKFGIMDDEGSYTDEIVILDTEDDKFVLHSTSWKLWEDLKACGFLPQQVVGIYKNEGDVRITPVSGLELSVLSLLENPHFYMADKLGAEGATAYKCFGLYNFGVYGNGWNPDLQYSCSIARLLLDSCGEVYERDSGAMRMETTPEYISVCVDNTDFQSLHLRFDISNYKKVNLAYTKYKVLGAGKGLPQSHEVTVEEVANSQRI